MLLAVSALVLSLLQQSEEASQAEPPVFQVETLLSTAELLPAGPERRAILDAALRDTESRAAFQTAVVRLLIKQDALIAARRCRELEGTPAMCCWLLVDEREAEAWHAEASVVLTSGAGARALLDKWQKQQRPPAEITRKMDRADKDDVAEAEKSRLLRDVLEASDAIGDIAERLLHQGFIAAWFVAVTLHKPFAEASRCEDGSCDSIAGRSACSDNIRVPRRTYPRLSGPLDARANLGPRQRRGERHRQSRPASLHAFWASPTSAPATATSTATPRRSSAT